MQSRNSTPEKEPRFHRKQLPHGKKYELQNQGQAGQITTPQSDESGNNGVTTVDGNGNAASDENKTNTPDDVQVEPEQDGNNTLS